MSSQDDSHKEVERRQLLKTAVGAAAIGTSTAVATDQVFADYAENSLNDTFSDQISDVESLDYSSLEKVQVNIVDGPGKGYKFEFAASTDEEIAEDVITALESGVGQDLRKAVEETQNQMLEYDSIVANYSFEIEGEERIFGYDTGVNQLESMDASEDLESDAYVEEKNSGIWPF